MNDFQATTILTRAAHGGITGNPSGRRLANRFSIGLRKNFKSADSTRI